MTDEKLDNALRAEEELMPSSGFLASVMERVELEAAMPPPIPFPWRRALPGMVLVAGVFGWGAVDLIRHGAPALAGMTLAPPHVPAAFTRPLEQMGWVALALGTSLASWVVSRRITGHSGLI
jgi:hypothetical protein